MAGFYIKEVRATGQSVPDASISFCTGLNIIQGRSDTGKTCVLKCIDFIFGSKNDPFDEQTGYDSVTMIVGNDNGTIILRRSLRSMRNLVTVESDIEGIDDGEYTIKYNKGSKRPPLNLVWMKLIGIDEEQDVPSNKDYARKRLTWRTLLRMFYITEGHIEDETSVILPERQERTLFLSSFLYLITGRDYAEQDPQTNKTIREQRKKAVEEYISKKIKDAAEKKKALEKQLGDFQGVDVQVEIDQMVNELSFVEHSISNALAEAQHLLSEIVTVEERAAESELMLSRFQSLRSQYTTDINRLTFIVEGEQITADIPQITKCPFCAGKMPARKKKSYINASRSELHRIMQQLQGLTKTEESIQEEHRATLSQLESLRAQRADIDHVIASELKPRAAKLAKSIDTYRAYIQAQKEVDVIADFAQSWARDIDSFETEASLEEKDKKEYRPYDYFPEGFQVTMTQYAEEILKECRYENITSARFDMNVFDIEVNGRAKKTSRGKGYRAYLNSVVALMFRRYMYEHALYNPHLLIIDTPLHGLDEGVPDAAPESMRTALFSYFINHQAEGQIIIVENLDHIPHLDYEASGAHVDTFTHDQSKGRYGFLYGVE